MDINPKIFREYDIRGIVDQDLTDGFRRVPGPGDRARTSASAGKRTWLSGRDCRLSSPAYAEAITPGPALDGVQRRRSTGMVPTPLIYFAIFHKKREAAVMITGSHNPPEYNGFKMMAGEETLYGDDDPGDLSHDQGRRHHPGQGRGALRRTTVIPEYEDYVTKNIRLREEAEGRARRGQRHGRGRGGADLPEAGRRGRRAVLRDGRPVSQSPSRPDAARGHGDARRDGPGRRAPTSASAMTATPTGSAWSTTGATSSGATSS